MSDSIVKKLGETFIDQFLKFNIECNKEDKKISIGQLEKNKQKFFETISKDELYKALSDVKETKPKPVKEKKQKDLSPNEMCKHIKKKGKERGSNCGKKTEGNSSFCKIHGKKQDEEDANTREYSNDAEKNEKSDDEKSVKSGNEKSDDEDNKFVYTERDSE